MGEPRAIHLRVKHKGPGGEAPGPCSNDAGCGPARVLYVLMVSSNAVKGAVRLALLASFTLLVPLAATSAAIGRIEVRLEKGVPVLNWSNTLGQAYIIETSSHPAGGWEKRATITAEAPDLSWADDTQPSQAMFYRVALATNPTIFQTLQQALHRACTNQGIVGASAAAFIPSEGLWIGTFGSSDGHTPVQPQTPFEVGSVTKTFVAATVLRLAEEGRLSLEDTVDQWLPGLNSINISSDITIRQLLNHRAGLYNFGDDLDFRLALFSNWSRRWQPEDVLKYVKAPYFPPDTDGQYSNTGYVLLGMIIRAATGASVAAEMRRTVLQRAALRSTFMGAEESWSGRLANPHLDFNGDGLHEDLGDRSQTAILTSFWTSGAEISTAGDLVRFGRCLFEGGLLNDASLEAMRAFRSIDIGGYRYDYGLGLIRFDILGGEYWAHSGGLFGEYGWFSYCPSTRTCMAVVYNYPVLKAGPSLPAELLIALSALTDGGLGASKKADAERGDPLSIRIPFLNSEISPDSL
jgi:D-alanyl-D-alanine carboxypeptidase